MAATRDLSVSLPADLADLVHHEVAAGEDATPSDVVGEGLRALQAQEHQETAWLRSRIGGSIHDRMAADPGASLSLADIRQASSATTDRDI